MFVTLEYIRTSIFAISFPCYLWHSILLQIHLVEVTMTVWDSIIKGMQVSPAGSAASHSRTISHQPHTCLLPLETSPSVTAGLAGTDCGCCSCHRCSLQLHSVGSSTGKSEAFWSCWGWKQRCWGWKQRCYIISSACDIYTGITHSCVDKWHELNYGWNWRAEKTFGVKWCQVPHIADIAN